MSASGGWSNIIDKYRKAKAYCDAPFEFMRQGSRYVQVPVAGEWIGEEQNGYRKRRINIRCASSTESRLKPASLDAVFTDPPYFRECAIRRVNGLLLRLAAPAHWR